MHSSTVFCSGHLSRGEYACGGGGVYPGGSVSVQEGCMPKGGCVCLWGCLPRGVCLLGCTPPPCGQTDTCKNITFPHLLLRTVNISQFVGLLITVGLCLTTVVFFFKSADLSSLANLPQSTIIKGI